MSKILITFPSWEERSVLGFEKFFKENPDIDKVYSLEFEQPAHKQKIEEQIRIIDTLCKDICKHINISNSEIEKWHMLDNFTKSINPDSNIYIDITTMPRSILWMLMFFLRQKYEKITAIYHRPKEYCKEWISKDPGIPQLLFKHSGIIDFEKRTTLFVLAGYDEERVIQLINFYEPYKVIIGECNPREDFKYGQTDIEKIDINQYNNLWGYDDIECKIKSILEESNLIVASLGPKIGAISVYQCFMNYPEIALSYVPCKEFNEHYSNGLYETLTKEVQLFKT